MILVTGANGHLGSQVIEHLLDQDLSADLAGLVRSEEKGAELKEKGVEVRLGDYRDEDFLGKALKGVDILLLVSSSSLEGRVEQHENVIQAAREEGVEQLFYTSMVKADKRVSSLAEDHADTEEILKDSGLPYTIYRHTFYTEFLPLFMGNALDDGQWSFPSDGEKVNLAFRSEMAEALAHGVANPEPHKNKVYEITSSNAYTLEEMTEFLNEFSGKEITYTDVSVQDFRETLENIGLPQEQIEMSVVTATTFVNGGLNYTYNDLEHLLGRKPTGVKAFIQKLIHDR